MAGHAKPYDADELKGDSGQRTFAGEQTLQIAMPLGGIGAGSISLNGFGGLQDFSIRHKPNLSAQPDGHGKTDAAFGLIHVRGAKRTTRLLEGPLPAPRVYAQGLKGQGFREGGHEGIPRFREATFKGEYPFGTVELSDPKVPLRVTLTGFNPFIPLDDKNSGIPCAILEYTFENRTRSSVSFDFSYHLSHLAGSQARSAEGTWTKAVRGFGVSMGNTHDATDPAFGSAALGVIGHEPAVKAEWFRGGWFDSISVLYREVDEERFETNTGRGSPGAKGRNGGSVMVDKRLKPGASVTIPVVIAWHFPNVDYTAGAPESACDCEGACDDGPAWRPWYVTQWKDAIDVARYVRKNYDTLRARTQAFKDAVFASTLPSYVLDAVSANLGILKSPTVLRQESGNVWAWEGCFCDHGCCHGSCTHVWNYAQAMPHLFPRLERTLREQELLRSMDERGHVRFRSALPDGPAVHNFPAAADGQLGGIMKVFREWQISGERDWLQALYPHAKTSLDYCIRTWDPDRLGVLIEPHHNTYDIEFWGPDGMCTSFYLGALAAMSAMAREMGDEDDAASYGELAEKGAAYLDAHLFNGEFYVQKVVWKGLRDTSVEERTSAPGANRSDVLKLEKKEGPRYQYGPGCLSDGVIGAWTARLYGIDTPQNPAHVKKNARAIFRHNFRDSLWEHCCTQRPGYANGDDPGLLLCSWPNGGKPLLPFPYSDEVWTGIEYEVASLLIMEGFVDEGLTVVKGARDRHEGYKRNPWNEYECGNFYARAMSSYALLQACSGFRYSAVEKTLWFGPKFDTRPFRTFFSTATGYGTITLNKAGLSIDLLEGTLAVDTLVLEEGAGPRHIACGLVAKAGETTRIRLT